MESLNLSTWGNNGSDSDTIRDISFLKNLTQLEQLTLDGLEDLFTVRGGENSIQSDLSIFQYA